MRAEAGEVVAQSDRLLRGARPDQLLGEKAELLPPLEGLGVGERGACLCHLPPISEDRKPSFLFIRKTGKVIKLWCAKEITLKINFPMAITTLRHEREEGMAKRTLAN